jgi:glycosyltransferase involved in cell wall biosynthesis
MSSAIGVTTSEHHTPLSTAALVVAPVNFRSGGLGTAAAEFADGLEALGYPSTFIGPPPPDALTRATRTRLFRRLFTTTPSRRLIARATRRSVPETGWDLAYAMPGSLPLERGSGLRVICQATRHPVVDWEALRRARRETGGRGDMSHAELRLRKREIEQADLIHVTTHAVQDEFLAAGFPADRIVHSSHGVDLDHFRPGPKPGDLRVAFVGPLSMRKGVDIVSELATRLGGKAVVEVVGGPTCPWSRRIAERSSFVFRHSVRDMLRDAHFFVLPSISDGFSYAVLEALASGAIPIVTPQVGASEIVERLDPRLVVERDEFVEATVALLADVDIGALGTRARALAEEYDRRRTSRAVAASVLARADALRAR